VNPALDWSITYIRSPPVGCDFWGFFECVLVIAAYSDEIVAEHGLTFLGLGSGSGPGLGSGTLPGHEPGGRGQVGETGRCTYTSNPPLLVISSPC